MNERSQASVITAALVVAFACSISYTLVVLSETSVAALTAGLVLLVVGFLSTEISLFILIASMLLSPEIMLGGASQGNMSRGVTIRFEDLLLSIIGLSWIAKMAIFKRGLVERSPLNRPIGLYIAACILSTIIGVMTERVKVLAGILYVMKYFQYFFIFFMAINNIHTKKQIRNYLIGFYLTCFFACLIGILNMPTTKRVSAPFEGDVGEPNTFGGYLLLLLSIALAIFIKTRRQKLRLAFLPVFGIAFPAFFLTLSRSSYASFTVAYLTLAYFLKERRTTMLAVLITIIGVAPSLLPESVINRVFKTFQEDRFSVKVGSVALDGSTSARLNSYTDVFRDLQDSPIFGFGVTGYKFIDAQYIKIMIETGFLGFGCFLFLIFRLFRHLHQVYRTVEAPEYKGMLAGLMAGLLGLLFHGFGTNTFIIVRIMEPFWFLVAIATNLPGIEARERLEPHEEDT